MATMPMTKKNFMQSAVKHPGALHRSMGVKKGQKIPTARLQSKARTLHKKAQKGKLTLQQRKLDSRVNLALRFRNK